MLGVFGTSAKAGSVIANKVWQGLACGRVVVTRRSAALDEIAGLVGGQLVTVEPGSSAAIETALGSIDPGVAVRGDPAARLQEYVDRRFADLGRSLEVVR